MSKKNGYKYPFPRRLHSIDRVSVGCIWETLWFSSRWLIRTGDRSDTALKSNLLTAIVLLLYSQFIDIYFYAWLITHLCTFLRRFYVHREMFLYRKEFVPGKGCCLGFQISTHKLISIYWVQSRFYYMWEICWSFRILVLSKWALWILTVSLEICRTADMYILKIEVVYPIKWVPCMGMDYLNLYKYKSSLGTVDNQIHDVSSLLQTKQSATAFCTKRKHLEWVEKFHHLGNQIDYKHSFFENASFCHMYV